MLVARAGRGAGGFFRSCKPFRDVTRSVLYTPDMFARYCLASCGPRRAVWMALRCCGYLLRELPDPGEREVRLRASLRAVVAAGADVRSHVPKHLEAAIGTGVAGVLEELLDLLSECPPDEQRELEGGLADYVAACCWALADVARSGAMVRVLLHAITERAGVRIFYYTLERALREASCEGQGDKVAALLQARDLLPRSLSHALHYAVKTHHAGTVEQLIHAGGTLSGYSPRSAWYGGHPRIVAAVAAALQRDGHWTPQRAAQALELVVQGALDSLYGDPAGQVARRSAALSVLVNQFGADPGVNGHDRGEGNDNGEDGDDGGDEGDGGGGGGAAALVHACALPEAFRGLASLLLLLGAEADAAMVRLCREPRLLDGRRGEEVEALGVLLSMGVGSGAGAAEALRAAVRHGRAEHARRLLVAGAVPEAACAEVLRQPQGLVAPEGAAAVVRGGGQGACPVERARVLWAVELAVLGALPPAAGAAGVSSIPPGPQAAVSLPGPDGSEVVSVPGALGRNAASGPGPSHPVGAAALHPVADPGSTSAAGSPSTSAGARAAAQAAGFNIGPGTSGNRDGSGCAGWTAEGALLAACRRGDVDSVRELASLGVLGERPCTAAFRAAVEAGQEECAEMLAALGAVPPEVEQQRPAVAGQCY